MAGIISLSVLGSRRFFWFNCTHLDVKALAYRGAYPLTKLFMVETTDLVNASDSLDSPQQLMTEDLQKLLEILPPELCTAITHHPQRDSLVEVVMDLGRLPEVRFPQGAEYLSDIPISLEQLSYCLQRVGTFSGDNRAGIERTLHRISAIRNRTGDIIGLTCRVGRAVFGTITQIGRAHV